MKRRHFLRNTAGISAATLVPMRSVSAHTTLVSERSRVPMVLSTWSHGIPANEAAWKVLSAGASALDAVEAGVRVSEADPTVTSVGYGGLPDRDGRVTLDACIMDNKGNAGSVACLEHIMHPISVARTVMEKTPHVMLVGDGALDFALSHGFARENLLTEDARKEWEAWKAKSGYTNPSRENHDTIGMIACDTQGNLSGACTTSGLAWKIHGRVGDSPIIGAGLFVDNEVGAACATGKGEAVIRIAGSAIVVELMRHNWHPQQACEEAVMRIIRTQPDYPDFQVGFCAMNTAGEIGAFSIHRGFQYSYYKGLSNELSDAGFAK